MIFPYLSNPHLFLLKSRNFCRFPPNPVRWSQEDQQTPTSWVPVRVGSERSFLHQKAIQARAASLKKTQAGQAHKCWRNVNQLRYWANFDLENGGITCSDRQKNEDFIGIYPVKLCNDNIIPSPSHINAPLNWPPKWVSPILSQGVLWTINVTEGIIFHGYVDNQTWSLTGQEFCPEAEITFQWRPKHFNDNSWVLSTTWHII